MAKKKNVSCAQCTKCCRHVAIEIDRPRSKEDYRTLVWYVMHKGVRVFLDEENDWYVEFAGDCRGLDPRGLCTIYDHRPDICREYDPECCVHHGEGEYHEVLLETKQDVENYVRKHTRIKNLYA